MEQSSVQLGGRARRRAELMKSARLLERLGSLLQGVVIALTAVGLVAALAVGLTTDCDQGPVASAAASSCAGATTHPYLGQAVGLAAAVLLLGVVITALLQLMIVVGKYCSFMAYGDRSDWIPDST